MLHRLCSGKMEGVNNKCKRLLLLVARRCKRRLKSAAGGARKVLHLPGKADWI
jgi:hypothetical protein